jgi:hypothetical protein
MANAFDVIHEGGRPSGPPVCEGFQRLADEWKSQAEFLTSPTAIAAIPAYQAIIAMGPAAVGPDPKKRRQGVHRRLA